MMFTKFWQKTMLKTNGYLRVLTQFDKFTLFFIFPLLITNTTFASDVLHKISLDSIQLGRSSAVILNGNLIFHDSDLNIMATDGTLSNTRNIAGDHDIHFSALSNAANFNNKIVFFNSVDYGLWQTDGESVSKINDIEFDLNFIVQDDKIFTKTSFRDKLLIISDDVTHQINIEEFNDFGQLNTLCRFDDNHFITISEERVLNNISDFEVNQIAIHEFDHEEEFRYLEFEFKFQGNCYYSYNEQRGSFYRFKKYFKVGNDLKINIISTTTDDTTRYHWTNAFVFNNNVYFNRAFFGLYSLENNSNEPQFIEAFTTAIGPYLTVLRIVAGKNFIFAELLDTGLPTVNVDRYSLMVLDKNYNETDYISGNSFSAEITTSGNNEFFHITNKGIKQLGVTNENGIVTLLSAPNINISKVIGDDFNTFIFANDKNGNYERLFLEKTSLFKYSDKPLISKQLAGLWVSPNWQSQGLSIHAGKRPDNTEYMFISFLLYKNGEPFWVAGSTDIDLGQDQVTIDLDEFKGMSFLPNEPNTQTQQAPFATITINPVDCNQIEATVKLLNNEEINLSMNRVIDIEHKKICID